MSFVPMPSMLYDEWAISEAEERWLNTLSHTLVPAKTKLTGKILEAYKFYICQVASTRAHPHFALSNDLFANPILDKEFVLNYFGDDKLYMDACHYFKTSTK